MVANTVIRVAERIEELARPLLEEHHPELHDATILWLLSSAKPTRQGRPLISVAKKLAPEARFLSSGLDSVEAGYDYVVSFAELEWRKLNTPQQLAAIDHALCSMVRRQKVNKRTGKITVQWGTQAPDVSEFTEVLERHGLWNRPLERFVKVGGFQLGLPMGDAIEPQLPAGRTTTVDESSTVVSTSLEVEKFTPYEERPLEELANGHAEEDWEEELTPAELEDVTNPVADPEYVAQIEGPEAPKAPTREAVLADLDARAEALDAREEQIPDSWRKRVGLGRLTWSRQPS